MKSKRILRNQASPFIISKILNQNEEIILKNSEYRKDS